MEAKQGLILVICSMILAGEVACFPATDVIAQSSFSQDDAAALAHFNWEKILQKLPHFLLPILRKILRGIKNSEDPMEILLSVLEGEKPSKKKKNKKNKKDKKNKEEEESGGNKEEESSEPTQ
ncbi:hypothetical protein OS493_024779 [Desmophyllum pertusum]|uniref:Uncharacterized protein n=1 Tax=Desmophyllum pertusum TaxID=174260 RepID=A0A9W9ZDE2_9CNID|nr:hypothetical protein OS493_024779 [Desmophyllum pertusum]